MLHAEAQSEGAGSGPIEQAAIEANIRDLPGDAKAYRHDWGRRNGVQTLTLNWGAIRPDTIVLASVGEGVVSGDTVAGKFVGAAQCSVLNVAPGFGKVVVVVHMNWGSPISTQVDYLISSPTGP